MTFTTPRRPTPDVRQTAARRGYDADHRRWREAVLRRDPLCVVCKRRGIVTPAVIADHIVPIAVDPQGRLELNNGRGVCRDCHADITGNFRATGINEPSDRRRRPPAA
jgi:5-methylcytosine-specific restriction endonuclease McrA